LACLGVHELSRGSERASLRTVSTVHEAAIVQEPKGLAVPLRPGEVAVAGDSRPLVHDRIAPADDAVEQRGLADVGPADDGHGGEASHTATSCAPSASAKSCESLSGMGRPAARSCAATASMNN